MDKQIEVVAKAICVAGGTTTHSWDYFRINVKDKYIAMAQAAISALQPTYTDKVPEAGRYIEVWECDECAIGCPCRVEIETEEDGLPDHVKGQDRFRVRPCLAGERNLTGWEKKGYLPQLKTGGN